jgi:hypothetical protein
MTGESLVTEAWHVLQIWRVATNTLNMQTADKGWSSSLGLGVGVTTSCYKNVTKGPRPGWIFLINDLS